MKHTFRRLKTQGSVPLLRRTHCVCRATGTSAPIRIPTVALRLVDFLSCCVHLAGRAVARTLRLSHVVCLLLLPVLLLFPISGCWHNPSVVETRPVNVSDSDQVIVVPANQEWTETTIDLTAGEAVTVVASGKIVARSSDKWGHSQEIEVGPIGTYLINDAIADQKFPMPSGAHGPAPCFSLIGRVGDGPPFFVGDRKSWVALRSGRLSFSINDFNLAENTGQFLVEVAKPSAVQPIAFEEVVTPQASNGKPEPDCSVIIFYIDGLRPDVAREMAALGHIPTIKELFVEGGCCLSNTFSVFPSDTITANATMWTGCFSDRHGLKGQVRFSRHRLVSESYLEPLGPNRSARLLKPQGIDRLFQEVQTASRRLIQGEDKSHRWRRARTTDVPPIYEHLRSQGDDWATGILPLMTDVPPTLWTRSIARHMPYFQVQNAWQYIDDANTTYALRHLLQRRNPVTIIWLPETDSISHKRCRGQFGMTRRTIAKTDQMIGQMVDEIRAQGRMNKTYFFLVSDHGHHGGRTSHLSHFDIANEVFFRPREMTRDGRWVGGGLGLSVRQHRFENRHRGDGRRQFVFIDGDSDGTARIFLPKGHYQSGDWSAPNQPGDLLAYRIAEHLPALNLVETLTATHAAFGGGTVQVPIDLVLMKLTDHSILISTSERGKAVIERQQDDEGKWCYRYRPVTDVLPAVDGSVTYRVVENPKVDPLKLLRHISPERLNSYYDEQTWLQGTAHTEYPDGVVALTRHMLWQENLRTREQEYAPDLVVTARSGWYFGSKSTPGTTHGYPLASSMRSCWYVSGPKRLPRRQR